MSGKTSGYHLFLEPEGELRETLQRIIASLAERYHGPVFPPHVTLVGPLNCSESEVRERAGTLAASMQPFKLTLGSLSGEASFFRAFYIEIEREPALIEMRERATEHFTLEDRVYTPHLSLFYGDIDEVTREEMRSGFEYPVGASFTVDRLVICRTEGPPEAWETIAVIPFSGQ